MERTSASFQTTTCPRTARMALRADRAAEVRLAYFEQSAGPQPKFDRLA